MKRWTALFLAICMALSMPFTLAQEMTDEAQRIINEAEKILNGEDASASIRRKQAFEDVCYGIDGQGALYRYDEATGSWNMLLSARQGETNGYLSLIATDDALMLLDGQAGKLYAYQFSDAGITLTEKYALPWDDMTMQEGDYSYPRQVNCPVIEDGVLYFITYNDEYNSEIRAKNIEAQTTQVIQIPNRYADGMTVAAGNLFTVSWKGLDQYNLATKTWETLMEMNTRPILSSYQDKLYLMKNSEIWSNRDGEFAVIAYAPAGVSWTGDAQIIKGGTRYVAQGYVDGELEQIEIDISAPMPDTVLKVAGYSNAVRDAMHAFSMDYPNVPIVTDEITAFDSAQSVVEHMRGATPADIYVFSLSDVDLGALARKDYAQPLDSTLLPGSVYPAFIDAVTVDGQLYALPVELFGSMWGYNTRFLETFGLTEDAMPTTYDELLDFIDDYQRNYADLGLDVQLYEDMQYIDMAKMITRYILLENELLCRANGEEVRFNSPSLLNTFEHIKNTDFSGFFDPENESTDERSMDFYDDMGYRALLNTSEVLKMYGDKETVKPLCLKLTKDARPIIRISAMVLMVNPDSRHMDEVNAFLSKTVEHYSDEMRTMLMSDQNEPVINQNSASSIAYTQAALDYLKEQSAIVDEVTQKDLKVYIDGYTETLDDLKAHQYIISKEAIDDYRSIAEYLFPITTTFVQSSDEAMQELTNRFYEGNMDAQSFLKELDRRVQMMALEGE